MTDTTDDTETLMTRRDALKGGSAAAVAAGSLLLQKQLVQRAAAQTNEPRIQLGSDYVFDDNPDGNGDLVIEHTPSGSELRYDSGADQWTAAEMNPTSLAVSGLQHDDPWERIDQIHSPGSAGFSFSGLNALDEYMIYMRIDLGNTSQNVTMTQNGNTNADYYYTYSDSTTVTNDSKWTLADVNSGFAFVNGWLHFSNHGHRTGIAGMFAGRQVRLNNVLMFGYTEETNSISSITIDFGSDFTADRTYAYLVGRETDNL